MKKVIFAACAIVLVSASTYAQENKPVPVPVPVPSTSPIPESMPSPMDAAPKVQHIEYVQFKEVLFEFGNIKAGIPASHVFEFKNVGATDISIDNVNASCGCTTPNWKGGIYKPGETGQITATYNAASVGSFNKNVTVTSSEGSIVLTISGTVMDAASYDAWKAAKDAEDALKAEEAAKNKSKKGKSKNKSKATTTTTTKGS